jgi:hypothetical protein
MKQLVHRARFDPRRQPEAIPPGVMQTIDDATAFFGIRPVNVSVVFEYMSYRAMWNTISLEDKSVGMSSFWLKRKGTYPALAQLGMRFAVKQPSSIAAERVFGMMRTMETSTRHSMKEKSFKAELFFRANSWVVDRVSCYTLVWRRCACEALPSCLTLPCTFPSF